MKPIVWVIDDESGICTSLQLALDDDYEVSTFTSSAEPLKRIERESCDVVLLDLKLGAEDGLEVLQKIKHRCPNVSVIMMTGCMNSGSPEERVVKILDKTVEKESNFTEKQEPLNDLEKEEKLMVVVEDE